MIPDTDNATSGTIMCFVMHASSQRLRDEWLVRRFLCETVAAIECRILEQITVHVPEAIRKSGEEPYADEGGVTGVAVLSTSHAGLFMGSGMAGIHTWPALTAQGRIAPWNGEARGVVDSCRPFTFDKPIAVIQKVFKPDYLRVVDWTPALRSWSGYTVPCTEAQRRMACGSR